MKRSAARGSSPLPHTLHRFSGVDARLPSGRSPVQVRHEARRHPECQGDSDVAGPRCSAPYSSHGFVAPRAFLLPRHVAAGAGKTGATIGKPETAEPPLLRHLLPAAIRRRQRQAGSATAGLICGRRLMAGSWANSTRRSRLPRDWPQIRARILRRDGYRCTASDKGVRCRQPATDVDHVSPGDDHSDSNLTSLCQHHHRIKSASEGGRRIHKRRNYPRRRQERHPGLPRRD